MRVVFIDTETTGLNPMNKINPDTGKPGTDQVIEYTLQVWQDGERAPAQTIRLWPWEWQANGSAKYSEVSPEVCKINGYDPAAWGLGPTGAKRIFGVEDCGILSMLDGAFVGGSNTQYDLDMITGEYIRFNTKPPRWNHRLIDTGKIFAPLQAVGKIKNTGLSALCEFFGITPEGRHSSAGDVRMTIDVWERSIDLQLKMMGL